MKTAKVLSILLSAGILNACAPQTQDLSSLTCASSENCSSVELDNALEKSEHDAAGGTPSVEALTIQWQESQSVQPLALKSQAPVTIPDEYKHLDPNKIVPARALSKAIEFHAKYKDRFKNKNVLAVLDFTQKNTNKRFYIIDLKTGAVEPILVAHGKNSDSDFDGIATKFSNIEGSLMSSIGAYMTAETYSGNHGLSLRLDGLESTNSLARQRAIVVHSADYVDPKRSPIGRSFGCPAIENKLRDRMITKLKGGALIYAWYNQ